MKAVKRIIAVVLCVAVVLALSACGEKTDSDTTTTKAKTITREQVAEYVKKGEIFGVDFALHANYDDIVEKYETTEPTSFDSENTPDEYYNQGDYTPLTIYEGERLTSLTAGSARFFFKNGQRDDGVAVIASSGTAFKFTAGNCFSDEIIYNLGTPDNTDVPAKQDLFFMFGSPQNATRLTYLFGSYRLDFIFISDNLSMTVLTDTEIYTDMGNSATKTAPTETNADGNNDSNGGDDNGNSDNADSDNADGYDGDNGEDDNYNGDDNE